MLDKCTGIDEPLAARDAFIWFLSGVDTSVDYQRGVTLELLVAEFTLKVLLIRVDKRMAVQTMFVNERF